MLNTTNYEYGDIVLVPFPFTDQTIIKKRPAVVISSALYHKNRPDVIVMAITSQIKAVGSLIEIVMQEWKESGLLKPSIIKPVFTTIEKGLIIRKLGKLVAQDRQKLQESLKILLGP